MMFHITKSRLFSRSLNPFPLKELPREVRDHIYDYVFEPGDITVKPPYSFSRTPTSTESAIRQDPQIILALLLVDRQIFHEAVQIFYSRRAFCIASTSYSDPCLFLRNIGQGRLDLIRTIRYSLHMSTDYCRDSSGQYFQSFWYPEQTQWRETFRYLRSACGLRMLEIDLRMIPVGKAKPSPREWAELETCLVGIKGRVDLLVSNRCHVSVKQYPVECQRITTEKTSRTNYWTCKKGQTEWTPMESAFSAEMSWKPYWFSRRTYHGVRAPCSSPK